MDKSPELEFFVVAMVKRRDEAKQILGDAYPDRVDVYIKIVRSRMAAKGINAIVASMELLEKSQGKLDPTSCAMIVAAAVDIIEKDEPGVQPHLTSLIFKGGLTSAVLVGGREHKEGVDHE